MYVGINNFLKNISGELLIKNSTNEKYHIERSLGIIIDKLKAYFGREVSDVIVFGSYTRDTILPRRFDEHSDIDILLLFNVRDYAELKPESYRSQLKKFAEREYPRALSSKDHPSIVLELNHIKFDLVPSIFDEGFFYDSIEIPNKNGGWMETNPVKFNAKLVNSNKRYGFITKPIVRLLKCWNVSQGYPYTSYELERHIADMYFRDCNLESGFLFAIENLPTYGLPTSAKNSIKSLQRSGEILQSHLKKQEIEKAKRIVEKILNIKVA